MLGCGAVNAVNDVVIPVVIDIGGVEISCLISVVVIVVLVVVISAIIYCRHIMDEIFPQGRDALEVFADGGCWSNGRIDAFVGYRLFFRDGDARNVCGVPVEGKQTNNRAHGFSLLGALVLASEKNVVLVTCSQITVRTSPPPPHHQTLHPAPPPPFTPKSG